MENKRTEISIEEMREILLYELKQVSKTNELTAPDAIKVVLFDLKAYENGEDWRV